MMKDQPIVMDKSSLCDIDELEADGTDLSQSASAEIELWATSLQDRLTRKSVVSKQMSKVQDDSSPIPVALNISSKFIKNFT